MGEGSTERKALTFPQQSHVQQQVSRLAYGTTVSVHNVVNNVVNNSMSKISFHILIRFWHMLTTKN